MQENKSLIKTIKISPKTLVRLIKQQLKGLTVNPQAFDSLRNDVAAQVIDSVGKALSQMGRLNRWGNLKQESVQYSQYNNKYQKYPQQILSQMQEQSTEVTPHTTWLKCMQMSKCTLQQAQKFVKESLQFINIPLTDSNQTMLMIAASIGSLQIVQCCLFYGANIKFKDSIGRTALHYTASSGSIQIFNLLVQKGANPLQQTIGGETALSKACMFNQGDIIEWYLNQCIGAFEIPDKCGKKPLDILKLNGEDLYEQVRQVYQQQINH